MDMRNTNNNNYDIASLIQRTLEPLISKVDKLEGKLDLVFVDRVTRSDIEKLRSEIQSSFVLRAEYEPRHAALIAQDASLQSEIKRIDSEKEGDFQRVHERLESGKQQIEDRFKDMNREVDQKIKEKEELGLNSKDRGWIRATQVVCIITILVAILEFASQHIGLR